MEQGPRPDAPLRVKQPQLKLLHITQPTRVTGELRERLLDADPLDLVREQVGLVEEENDGNVRETSVVDDHLEYVARLYESIGASVLIDRLVEFAGGSEEEDRCDPGETLEPLLTLRPLPAHVDEPERYVTHDELVFTDALRGLARVQDVEVCGGVVLWWQDKQCNGK